MFLSTRGKLMLPIVARGKDIFPLNRPRRPTPAGRAARAGEFLRSEVFGHERGAFTGAVSRTAGLVARLDGGTLLMDEIGELPPDAQGMLLRFLSGRRRSR